MNAFVIDYEDSLYIWRHTVILAACSAPTYIVNTFLGIRCIDEISKKEKIRLANFSLSIYIFFIIPIFNKVFCMFGKCFFRIFFNFR